jgi:hypothetical protein
MEILDKHPALDKHLPESQVVTWVGVVTDLRDRYTIRQWAKPTTRAKAIQLITSALETGTMSSAQASTIRGTCQWVLCSGTAGRAALQCLVACNKGRFRVGQAARPIDRQLREGLQYLKYFYTSALQSVEYPVCKQVSTQRPIIVLSDASWKPLRDDRCGNGEVGYIVLFPPHATHVDQPALVFASAKPPRRLLEHSQNLQEKDQMVAFLETVALAAPYFDPAIGGRFCDVIHFGFFFFWGCLFIKKYLSHQKAAFIQKVNVTSNYLHVAQDKLWDIFRDEGISWFAVGQRCNSDSLRGVIHFGDNQGANFACRKGYSSSADMGRVVCNLHHRWLHLDTFPWIQYVNTKMNWADDPSRGFCDGLRARQAVEIPFYFPEAFESWGHPVKHDLSYNSQ